MKIALILFCATFTTIIIGALLEAAKPVTMWSGNSLFTTVSNGQTNSIVIGLRNDGVMVWRLSTNN